MTPLRAFACSLVLVGLFGCGSGGSSQEGAGALPETPLEVVNGERGLVSVEVRTAPTQPPPRGLVTVGLTIQDRSGKPLDGLSVSVVPWMPAMGHGTSTMPTITPKGDGLYEVADVGCFMPGRWELRTTIDGAVQDRVVASFEVP